LSVNALLVPMKRILMGSADFVSGTEKRLAIILFEIELTSFRAQHGGADLDRLAVGYRK